MAAVIGIIPARFGSQRLLGKLLLPFSGKPLIQLTYENAARCSQLDRLLVATDHPQIASVVRGFGGEVVMTSENCRSGTERLAEVVEHHLDGARGSILVNIQGDWPCLEPEVIGKVADLLATDWGADIGTAAIPLTATRDLFNPSKVKCVISAQGRALYFSRAPLPYCATVGLEAPLPASHPFYCHLGIYSYRPDFLLRFRKLPPSPLEITEGLEQLRALENGYAIRVAVVNAKGVLSVDTQEDVGKLQEYLCNPNTCSSQEESSPLSARG
jgi:3-deoxy-manno-octulosonate cytidylyltransferase (CMP-KDO synthetase)